MNDLTFAYFHNMMKALAGRFPGETLEFAFMGYPDIVVPDTSYVSLIGEDWQSGLENRPNADAIKKIHRRHDIASVSIVPTLSSAIEKLRRVSGIENEIRMTVFDFQTYEGSEILHDFNEPLESAHENKYHLLWNGGTLEHIFDIATALNNMTFLTRKKA